MKYTNTSNYPRYQTSENVLCLNEDNIPLADQWLFSLFQSVVFFLLNAKLIGDSVLVECYEKKLQEIGTVKSLVAIQLVGYMHLIDPIALLWATVSKGTTGPANFFRITYARFCS